MTVGSGAQNQVSNRSQDQCACMSELLKEYESVHVSRVMTRAFRLREHSGGFKPQNRARLKPAERTLYTVLTMDEVRSDVLGVTDGSAVIGHEEIKNTS